MYMYVEIRLHQEPPWHYKPQQNGNRDIILKQKKLNESDKQEETKTAIIVLRKNYH